MPHTLRTERLLLRPPELRDAKVLVQTLSDSRVTAPTKLWPFPISMRFATMMLGQAQRMVPFADHIFMIFEGSIFAGTIGVHQRRDDVYGVGYMLGSAFWGRGIATEAVRAVCAFGFAACRANLIVADTFQSNVASQRVLEKVGMRNIGDIGPGWSTTLQGSFPRWGYQLQRTDLRR